MASSSSSSSKLDLVLLIWLACIVVVACMGGGPLEAASISCGTVTSSLSGCLPYLTGRVASAPAGCCSGVKSLYSATKASRPDRVAACNCIVSTSKSVSGLQAARVAGLPGTCGVNLGYKPSANTNCASIA